MLPMRMVSSMYTYEGVGIALAEMVDIGQACAEIRDAPSHSTGAKLRKASG